GGMAQALTTAELLAPAVVDALAAGGDHARADAYLHRFDRRRRALLRDYLLLTRFMLFLVRHPPLARATLRLMRATPRLMSHLTGVAGGTRRLLPALRLRDPPRDAGVQPARAERLDARPGPAASVPTGGAEVLH